MWRRRTTFCNGSTERGGELASNSNSASIAPYPLVTAHILKGDKSFFATQNSRFFVAAKRRADALDRLHRSITINDVSGAERERDAGKGFDVAGGIAVEDDQVGVLARCHAASGGRNAEAGGRGGGQRG